MKTGLIITLLLVCSLTHALSVYKCTTETGTVSYQETPCQGNEPTMLEKKGIVDAESYQNSLKLRSGSLANYQVSMLTFKWWRFFKNEVSDQFLHFKFTDNTGDTDISLLIDFIEPKDEAEIDQMKVKNLVVEKGKVFEKMSVIGKTNIKTLKVDEGYGYYATYKDASLVGKTSYPPGEYLNTTQGMLKKNGLVINFTLLSNDTSAENYIFALQFLAKGVLIEEKQNDAESDISLLDRAYETYYEGAKLKALMLFEQLVIEQPNQFKSWIGYCLALRDNNRLQMALVACDRALGFKPGDPDVFNSIINIMMKARQYEKGLSIAQQLIETSVKPQVLDTINNLGFYAMIDGELSVAQTALGIVKREAGPTTKVMMDLAELDYLQGRKEQAVATFERIAQQQSRDDVKQYYLDPISKGETIHPPHTNHESYTDIPAELLNIGNNQLNENMVHPWVKRYYPVLGVGQLEINVPEKWAENVQLKTINDKTKYLSLIIAGMESLTQITINLGKVDGEWTLSDLETHMKSSLKLYFKDKKLTLDPISKGGKGFQYKGMTPSEQESHFVYATSLLDGVIALDVVGLSLNDDQAAKDQLVKIINSIKLTDTNQTAIKTSAVSAEKPSELINENLLQGLPLPSGEWDVYQAEKEDTNLLETRWVSKTSDDMVQTFVLLGSKNGDVNESKEFDNAMGQKNCDKIYESDVISNTVENGYPQLTWYTLCKTNSGFYSKAIHKSIAGNDSMYEVKRIFRSEPSSSDWQIWLDYISTIKVCDSRIQDQACPSSLKRVK